MLSGVPELTVPNQSGMPEQAIFFAIPSCYGKVEGPAVVVNETSPKYAMDDQPQREHADQEADVAETAPSRVIVGW